MNIGVGSSYRRCKLSSSLYRWRLLIRGCPCRRKWRFGVDSQFRYRLVLRTKEAETCAKAIIRDAPKHQHLLLASQVTTVHACIYYFRSTRHITCSADGTENTILTCPMKMNCNEHLWLASLFGIISIIWHLLLLMLGIIFDLLLFWAWHRFFRSVICRDLI